MSGMTTGDRPPNVAALAAQLDSTMGILYERLAGLTDEEYLWEPAPSCWSLRPRGQHRTAKAYGKGDWVWEYEAPTPGARSSKRSPPRSTHRWGAAASRGAWTRSCRWPTSSGGRTGR